MEIKDDHRYGKSVDAVYRFFSDPDMIKTKLAGVGARNIEILECADDGLKHVTRTRREVPSDVPGVLKKFMGEWNKVEQSEKWELLDNGNRTCELSVNVVGVPISVTGNFTLLPDNDGCVNQVVFKIKCGIPFVGGTLESFVGSDIKRNMVLEYDFIKQQP